MHWLFQRLGEQSNKDNCLQHQWSNRHICFSFVRATVIQPLKIAPAAAATTTTATGDEEVMDFRVTGTACCGVPRCVAVCRGDLPKRGEHEVHIISAKQKKCATFRCSVIVCVVTSITATLR